MGFRLRHLLPVIYFLLYIKFLAFYWGVYVLHPAFHQAYFRGEDKLVEWMTFAGFFAASIIMVLAVFRFKAGMTRWARLYVIGLAFFFFVCAGEEISWGQRIFGFDTPEVMEEVNEQREFNLHNLHLKHIHPADIVSIFMLFFGIVLPLVLFQRTRQPADPLRRYLSPPHLVPCFLLAQCLNSIEKHVRPHITQYGNDVVSLVRADSRELTEMYWGISVFLAVCALFAAWKRYQTDPSVKRFT